MPDKIISDSITNILKQNSVATDNTNNIWMWTTTIEFVIIVLLILFIRKRNAKKLYEKNKLKQGIKDWETINL